MTEPRETGRTTTQPRPNLSTEPKNDGDGPPTETQPRPNLSTEHQESGDARRPGDTLDRGQRKDQPAGRKTSLTRNE